MGSIVAGGERQGEGLLAEGLAQDGVGRGRAAAGRPEAFHDNWQRTSESCLGTIAFVLLLVLSSAF